MFLISSIVIWLFFCSACFALLEDNIVTFKPQHGAIPIHDATIFYDTHDLIRIHIVTKSLAEDLGNITGKYLDYVIVNIVDFTTRAETIICSNHQLYINRGP